MRISLIGLAAFAMLTGAVAASSAQFQDTIPLYIKNYVLAWAQGDVDDQGFIAVVQFMIETGMIEVPQVEMLKQDNQELQEQIATYEGIIHNLNQERSENLTISVHTNKREYVAGDTIMIFGFVSHVVPDHTVGIVISDPVGNILAIAHIPPNIDGSYGFVAADPIFREFGEYSVHVYYGGMAYSDLTYLYRHA